ncbi:MAG: 6-carboxytetrahydropterin synthase [Cyanobacteria bacterium P01_H01_bin.74]
MFEVMVEKHFAAAHHLINYRGKCENPHGHNYVVQAYAEKDTLDKANVSFDFSVMKGALKEIINTLDHTDLNTLPDFVGESPSAEFISRYIYNRMKKTVPELTKVIVYETPTQYACYFEKEN